MGCEVLDHPGRGVAARLDGAAQADRRRGDGRRARRQALPRRPPHRQRGADDRTAATTGATTCDVSDDPESCPCEPMDARTCSSSCTRAARPRSRRGSSTRRPATSSAPRRRTTTSSTSSRTTDVYWCAADIGWITGHSYIVYGPLCNGTTSVLYEGTPDFPDKDRWWSIVERYGVTILYTAPTAIRAHMKWGSEHAQKHDLSSLRLLGSVGEPINPEAWIWYREHIGGDRCPVVDTWWQTETGMILITPLPGVDDDEAGLGDEAVSRGRRGDLRRARQRGRPRRRRLPRPARAMAGDDCAGSSATTSATARRTGRSSRASTSPVTARGSTPTATSGSSAASTT